MVPTTGDTFRSLPSGTANSNVCGCLVLFVSHTLRLLLSLTAVAGMRYTLWSRTTGYASAWARHGMRNSRPARVRHTKSNDESTELSAEYAATSSAVSCGSRVPNPPEGVICIPLRIPTKPYRCGSDDMFVTLSLMPTASDTGTSPKSSTGGSNLRSLGVRRARRMKFTGIAWLGTEMVTGSSITSLPSGMKPSSRRRLTVSGVERILSWKSKNDLAWQ
mmetsp:Transcript_65789/g.208222  ORF Transcript_65789/g.208222 Transcript_65789/m.208222 type:complete len:219 (-) Transcript_65789:372-1028(-)